MGPTPPDGYVHVLDVDQLAEGTMHEFEVEGKVRILARLEGGEVRALDGVCTHEQAQLVDGDLEGTTIWCPFHAAGFDATTGIATCLPAKDPLCRYDVRTDDGHVFVARDPLPPA
jgi:3-phenylpropionate/trans-cinnamate dioxygenase ferredoxin component